MKGNKEDKRVSIIIVRLFSISKMFVDIEFESKGLIFTFLEIVINASTKHAYNIDNG